MFAQRRKCWITPSSSFEFVEYRVQDIVRRLEIGF